jgi:hypothetical protein
MPRNRKVIHRANFKSPLEVATDHLERVKDVAIGLGEARGIWTPSAATALSAYIQEQADAALVALKQLKA